jgi:hypothetical protein
MYQAHCNLADISSVGLGNESVGTGTVTYLTVAVKQSKTQESLGPNAKKIFEMIDLGSPASRGRPLSIHAESDESVCSCRNSITLVFGEKAEMGGLS